MKNVKSFILLLGFLACTCFTVSAKSGENKFSALFDKADQSFCDSYSVGAMVSPSDSFVAIVMKYVNDNSDEYVSWQTVSGSERKFLFNTEKLTLEVMSLSYSQSHESLNKSDRETLDGIVSWLDMVQRNEISMDQFKSLLSSNSKVLEMREQTRIGLYQVWRYKNRHNPFARLSRNWKSMRC